MDGGKGSQEVDETHPGDRVTAKLVSDARRGCGASGDDIREFVLRAILVVRSLALDQHIGPRSEVEYRVGLETRNRRRSSRARVLASISAQFQVPRSPGVKHLTFQCTSWWLL